MLDARKTLFLGGGDELAIAQEHGGGIMVIAGNSKNVHELLFLCPAHVVNVRGVIDPLRGALLDLKRVREQARHQTERQDYYCIQNREKHARLKITDPLRYTLPCVPAGLQILDESFRHRLPRSLEQTVDERRKSRALRQHDDHTGKKHHANYRQQPPALVARKE